VIAPREQPGGGTACGHPMPAVGVGVIPSGIQRARHLALGVQDKTNVEGLIRLRRSAGAGRVSANALLEPDSNAANEIASMDVLGMALSPRCEGARYDRLQIDASRAGGAETNVRFPPNPDIPHLI